MRVRRFAPGILAICLLGLTECVSKQHAVGIRADEVHKIQVGSTRADVEKIVNSVEHGIKCNAGSRIFYAYDRGRPPGNHPVAGALVSAGLSFFSLGTWEVIGACQSLCQQGLLEVIYDKDDHAVAAYPHPYAYDVGFYCGARSDGVPVGSYVPLSGDLGTSVCSGARRLANQTDLAKTIEGDKALIEAVGCE